MKKYIMVVCCMVIVFTCTSCIYKSWWGKRACDQPGTEWVSGDGNIRFRVDETGSGIGTMKTQSDEIDIFISMGLATRMDVYRLSSLKGNVLTEPLIEYWEGKFKRDDEFTATVETTTYFEIGQKITFYRVDDGERGLQY